MAGPFPLVQEDHSRLFRLLRDTVTPQHPGHQYGTGNYDTLWTRPKKRGVDVREELLRFHAEYYSANLMKVAVFGREPLDQLAEMVASKFSAVPNKSIPRPRFDYELWPARERGTFVYYKPVKDLRSLQIYIPTMDFQPHWRSKPGAILSHFLGQEGAGSILSYLKSRDWASNILACANGGAPGFDIFRISLELTPQGLVHYEAVLATVFDYIELLRETIQQHRGSLPRWIFEEQQRLCDLNFEFGPRFGVLNTILQRCLSLWNEYPPEWTLTDRKLREFDMNSINAVLSQLRPERACVFLSAQNLPEELLQGPDAVPLPDLREEFSGAEFSTSSLPASIFDPCRARTPHLTLPRRNQFVPEDLSVRRPIMPGMQPVCPSEMSGPVLLSCTPRMRLWYQPDLRFGQPKADTILRLKYATRKDSARDKVIVRLLSGAFFESLSEYSYEAISAGLDFALFPEGGSLWITVMGYNDKQLVLLRIVLERLKTFDPHYIRLANTADRFRRAWADFHFNAPAQQANNYLRWFCHDDVWLPPDLLAELDKVTDADVIRFRDDLLTRFELELYVHGNYDAEEAIALRDMVEQTLPPSPNLDIAPAEGPHSLLLAPRSDTLLRLALTNPDETNSAVVWFAQIGTATPADLEVCAALGLLASIARQPAFAELRTNQQLGYLVYAQPEAHDNSLGLSITIQSEYSPRSVRQRVEHFLRDQLATLIRDMPPKTFAERRAAHAATLQQPANLNEETYRVCTAIGDNTYDFTHTLRLARAVQATTLADVQNLFMTYIHPDSPYRSKLILELESTHAKPLRGRPSASTLPNKQARGHQTSHSHCRNATSPEPTPMDWSSTGSRPVTHIVAHSLADALRVRSKLQPSHSAQPLRPWVEYTSSSAV